MKTPTLPRTPGAAAPQLVDLPPIRVAVVTSVGDPVAVGPKVLPALYSAVYQLKFARKKEARDFKVGTLRAQWSGAFLGADGQLTGDRTRWQARWALPVPGDTLSVRPKDLSVEVTVEDWSYGLCAQVLHVGPYSTEPATIRRLHDFIAESGYEIAGLHEEEYLTRLDARVPKTLIRYPIRWRQGIWRSTTSAWCCTSATIRMRSLRTWSATRADWRNGSRRVGAAWRTCASSSTSASR